MNTNCTTFLNDNDLHSDLETLMMLFSQLALSEKDTGLRLINEAYAAVFEKRLQVMNSISEGKYGDIVPNAIELTDKSMELLRAAWQWKGTSDKESNAQYVSISRTYCDLLNSFINEGNTLLTQKGESGDASKQDTDTRIMAILNDLFVKLISFSTEACELTGHLIQTKLADGERTLH